MKINIKNHITSHLNTQGKNQPCSDAANNAAPFNSNVEAVEKPKKHRNTLIKCINRTGSYARCQNSFLTIPIKARWW